MEDLCTLVYTDASIMREIKDHKGVTPVLFKKFIRAAANIPGFAAAGSVVAEPIRYTATAAMTKPIAHNLATQSAETDSGEQDISA